MMCLAATGVVTVLWVLYGYSVSLGGDSLGGVIGDSDPYRKVCGESPSRSVHAVG